MPDRELYPSTRKMPAMEPREYFPHGADMEVRGLGATLEEAFAQAALSLTAVVSDPAAVAPKDFCDSTSPLPLLRRH